LVEETIMSDKSENIIAALEYELYKVRRRVINYALNQETQQAEDVLTEIERDVTCVLRLRGYQGFNEGEQETSE